MKPPLTREHVAAAASDAVALGDPTSPETMLALVRLLYAIGRKDLPLGRLVEGHVDAVQIVRRYGTPGQVIRAVAAVQAGRLFGVWNADCLDAPARLDGTALVGGKSFASGAGLVTDALVSVDTRGGRQLLLMEVETDPPAIDRSWWRTTGMQRSETHIVTWPGTPLPDDVWIGRPGDYAREPWFGGGAIRFAAVQAGGVAALVDGVRDHLVVSGRSDDALQRARLADLHGAAQAAADAVRTAALSWSLTDAARTLALVAAARAAVYWAGEEGMRLAAAAVGVQAMFVNHPLADTMRDLDVYLRQPAPDAQRLAVGKAVVDGTLMPAL